ncbi:GDSL esterase/lipase At5g55050-like [Rutidosis leptorrhynchoides]|uniref:GDSL esterase/lipase At5g55050-like n=1 Tax=Rutidosis leptorrhynchoides TaxID=125765 RepID=UPI003A991716
MATFINAVLCVCVLLVFGTCGTMCESVVPGFYVFGDSLVDNGNNNYLTMSLAKADFPHNGIDYPTGEATGRFSNGKNAADFLAEKVGQPSAPPYLSLVSKSKKLSSTNEVVTGVNFASGAATILNPTDELFQKSIPLTKQVGFYFLVHDELIKQMGLDGAQAHLTKSIFLIVIGSNDLFGYFNEDSEVSKQYTPQQYVDLLASTLKGLMKQMYVLGARKFVISGVGVIGCCPAQRKHNALNECNLEANYLSIRYNEGLKAMLRDLKTELSDINYSYFDTYYVMSVLIQNPLSYGITEIEAACCGLGNLKADIPCIPISTYCSNRKNHLFWDLYHPTETVSSMFAGLIYNGSQEVTTPMNVEELVKL